MVADSQLVLEMSEHLGAGAVGDKHQVVLREDNALLRAVDPALDGGGRLSAVPDVEDHVGDLGAETEVHPGLLQVLLHGQDQGLVLVVPGKFQGAEVGESRDVVDEALEVELHLQGAVPVLKGKHGPPVQPEGGSYRSSSGVMKSFMISMQPFWLRLNFPSVRASRPRSTVARHRE